MKYCIPTAPTDHSRPIDSEYRAEVARLFGMAIDDERVSQFVNVVAAQDYYAFTVNLMPNDPETCARAYGWMMRTITDMYRLGLVLSGAYYVTDYSTERQTVIMADAESLETLSAMPYKRYLRSSHWQRIRAGALERANHRCQVCNGPDDLHVHHRSYERRGCEEPADVIVLCKDCHERFHDVKDGRANRMPVKA